jgi:hypothetical protein
MHSLYYKIINNRNNLLIVISIIINLSQSLIKINIPIIKYIVVHTSLGESSWSADGSFYNKKNIYIGHR